MSVDSSVITSVLLRAAKQCVKTGYYYDFFPKIGATKLPDVSDPSKFHPDHDRVFLRCSYVILSILK